LDYLFSGAWNFDSPTLSKMQPIVEVRNISKRYRLGHSVRHTNSLREFLVRGLSQPWKRLRNSNFAPTARSDDSEFWALRDISFDVADGEVIGVIGRNGAGKSTLLKILSRITDPTEGHIKLRGHVSSLLEVGTGFHPELTGRENIFLNGALLGMKRADIIKRFDEIVAFSEIEKFLDTPVKHYSSGMYVRLAFAVAAHLNPDILVVDEVLAVGDLAFQKKCMGKMTEVSKAGRTVLFVSHNMPTVESLCQRGIVLMQGKMVFSGTAKDAVQHYLNSLSGLRPEGNRHIVDLKGSPQRRSPMGELLQRIELYTDGDQPLYGGLPIGGQLKVHVHFNLEKPTSSFNVGLGFNNGLGQRIFTAHSLFEPQRDHGECVGPQVFICDIPSLTLTPGDYLVRVWLDVGNAEADLISDALQITVYESDYYGTGKVPWNGAVVLQQRWHLDALQAAARRT
jgi:lipopolysaccharide transport system ATP-binding protein